MTDPTLVQRLIGAALEHAAIPPDPQSGLRRHSPMYTLIPDGEPVPQATLAAIREVTGRPVPGEHNQAFLPPRARAHLTRWAVREHHESVVRMRNDHLARVLWREANARRTA